MKRHSFTCLSLSLALLAGTAGAAFHDIQNTDLAQAAASLSALAIMQGDGAGNFEPNRSLTRAEFTKLAATSLGLSGRNRLQQLYPVPRCTLYALGIWIHLLPCPNPLNLQKNKSFAAIPTEHLHPKSQ